MARLIDADALVEHCKELASIDWNSNVAPQSWASAYESFAFEVEGAPTIEAEPVKHGEWVSLEADIGLFACSNCGHKILRAECNYCPKCGAKMDGGNNEQERTD